MDRRHAGLSASGEAGCLSSIRHRFESGTQYQEKLFASVFEENGKTFASPPASKRFEEAAIRSKLLFFNSFLLLFPEDW